MTPTPRHFRQAPRRAIRPLSLAILLAVPLPVLLGGCGPGPEEPAAATAAAEVAPMSDALRAEAAAQHEAARLAALWHYVSVAVDGESRPQKSASMRNLRPDEDDVATTFAVVPTVQLVLRNDPRWGQSVYLVIEEGDFDCGSPCAFTIRFDASEPRRFDGEASSTGERPALFINDDTGFIRGLDGASRVEIAPAHAGSPIIFETGGFDPRRYGIGA
ncbi:MAG TPA: hypothetical protein DCM32_00530 [Xanthomonadaceae bacterium]|jgi:hypothetical protein|nr:hypothetical protein [Xanthomonadaceae bacterium]